MSGPLLIEGAPVPLFDRLAERGALFDPRATVALDVRATLGAERPADERASRVLDRDGLAASIAREIDELLNTRTPLAADALERRPRSTVDYGLPDLSRFWPLDPVSRDELATLIERTVAAYEPRLLDPRARVEPLPDRRRVLLATVSGGMLFERLVQPVSFPILLRDGQGATDAG